MRRGEVAGGHLEALYGEASSEVLRVGQAGERSDRWGGEVVEI